MTLPWFALVVVYLTSLSALCNGYTEKSSFSLDLPLDDDTIHSLLTQNPVDPSLLRRLNSYIAALHKKVAAIDKTTRNLPQQLRLQLSYRAITNIENILRNKLDEYELILSHVRSLTQNRTSYDNATYITMANRIKEELDALRTVVRNVFPDNLRSLDRNLRGDTLSGGGSTEGLICDAAVNALIMLVNEGDLKASVGDGPVSMLEGLIDLQKLAIDFLTTTCEKIDPVCYGRVAGFRRNPQRQRDKLAECIPSWVISLVKDGRVTGRLLASPSNLALTRMPLYHTRSDETRSIPELQGPKEGRQQLLLIEAEGKYYRLVLGDTCHIGLHHITGLECFPRSTRQDATFKIVTTREGHSWLNSVETDQYVTFRDVKGSCLPLFMTLTNHTYTPWTFDARFNPKADYDQQPRDCRPPMPTTTPPRESINASDRSSLGVIVLILPLLVSLRLSTWLGA